MIGYIISSHAKSQFKRRKLHENLVKEIIENPDQIVDIERCVHVYQSLIIEAGNNYLVRIFVNVCTDPFVIITGYRTSKIDKYYES